MNKVEFFFILFFVYILQCPQVQAQLHKQNTCLIEASVPTGIYYKPHSLLLSSNCQECLIKYTLDAKEPTKNSTIFSNPIVLEKNIILLAACFDKAGKKTSNTYNFTYIFNENSKLPIVSITIDPYHLFNPATGLFVGHKSPGSGPPPSKANYKSNRRVLCYVDFFEVNKSHCFSTASEFKLFGGYSRMFAQKSISLRPNEKLGQKKYFHAIFPSKKYIDYKDIVLRNSGTDWGASHFRDALITSLGADINLITQAYRPSIVYINGEFWGIYNLRERISKHFISRYGNIPKDSIDFMEHRAYVNKGSGKHYEQMKAYIQANDLSKDEHFDYISKQMNIINFLDYQSVQIFCDNKDAGGNSKYFRGQKAEDKWQWILFDTDYGFGQAGAISSTNSLAFHLESNGPRWPNPPWSTFLLRNLLKNKKGKELFVSRFLDRLNTTFSSDYIEKRVDSIVHLIAEDMPRHIQRWQLSEERWHREIGRIKNFVKDRAFYIRKYLLEEFPEYGDSITFIIRNPNAIPYKINEHLTIVDTVFQGIYFSNLHLHLQSNNRENQNFLYWKIGDKIIKDKDYIFTLKDFEKGSMVEIFVAAEAFPQTLSNAITIKTFNEGILEIYNTTDKDILLAGWYIKNNFGENFKLPNIHIARKNSLFLCNDLAEYRLKNQYIENVIFCPIPIQDNLFLQTPTSENTIFYKKEFIDSSNDNSIQLKIKDIKKSEHFEQQERAELFKESFSYSENYKIATSFKIILLFFTILAPLIIILIYYLKKNQKE